MARSRLIRDHADFRRLWIGDGVSQVCTSVVVLGVPVLAASTLDATTWQVALLGTFATLPYLVVGLPAGAWADRLRRRPVLIAADLARAAALAWIPVAALLGVLTIGQVFAVQLVVGVGTVFFEVCQGAYVPGLVGRRRLVEGNSLLAANHTVAVAAGPTAGGQAVQWLGPPLALVSAVVGYLWSAAWLLAIRTPEPRPARVERRSLVRDIANGMRFVLGHPFIRATAMFGTTAVLCLSTRYAVEVLFLLRTVGLSAAVIGLVMTASGAGAIAGALVAGRIARAVGRVRAIVVASLAMGLGGLLIPLTSRGWGLVYYAAGAAAVAFWITVNNVIVVSVRQMLCPDGLLGRMNASTRFLARAGLPAGGVVGGALGTAVGLRTTLWLAAVGMVCSSLWILLSPTCRQRDLAAPAEPAAPVTEAVASSGPRAAPGG